MKQELQKTNELQSGIRLQTPVGTLILEAQKGAVSVIRLAGEADAGVPESAPSGSALDVAAREMQEYFDGKRKKFTFPMHPAGTPFQQKVWQALLTIPYGETRSYRDIALQVGNPQGARAVGGACNKNPLWIAVPCHRVIGSNGALTGYALGTGMKQALLSLEQINKIR